MKDIVIKAPNTGISSSPHVGFGDVRNLDIFSIPGIVRLNNLLAKKSGSTVAALVQWFMKDPTTPANIYALDSGGSLYKTTDSGDTWASLAGKTVTVDISTPSVATFTSSSHNLAENDTVVFSTTGALPTGLVAGTTYYIIAANLAANTFSVSTSQGGAGVVTSGTQSGTHSFYCTTGRGGQGLAIFEDYLIVARQTKLDTYGPLSGSPTWRFNWQTVDSDTLWHPMFVSKNDGICYGGAGRYVFSIEEVTGQTFAPTNTATYTFISRTECVLPWSYRIKCIEESGENMLFGTWKGTNYYDYKVADIFPWFPGSLHYQNPIRIADNGVHAMLNKNGTIYILAGIEGKMYQSNGAVAYPIAQIPISITDLKGGTYLTATPQSLINYKDKICFAFSAGGSSTIDGMGVWSLMQTSRGNILNLEHGISTGNFGLTTNVQIGALLDISNDTLLVGWKDATSYGIDKTTNTSRSTGYTAYFESPLYNIGTYTGKGRINDIEFSLVRPLATGEGIKIKYRKDLSASWTTLITLDYTTLGAVQSHVDSFTTPPIDSEYVQIRCELTTGASSNTSPELRFLILR